MGHPRVSVVVPARNEADYVGACLDSIAGLDTDHDHETIVVDGDSDDGTAAIAREHGARVVKGPGEGIGAGATAALARRRESGSRSSTPTRRWSRRGSTNCSRSPRPGT